MPDINDIRKTIDGLYDKAESQSRSNTEDILNTVRLQRELVESWPTISRALAEAAAREAQLVKDLDGWRRYVYQVRDAAKADDGEPFSKVIERIATLQRERDEAEKRCAELNSSLFQHLMQKQKIAAERDALQRELDAALEQQQGHACAMATLAEERDALQRAIAEAYLRWELSSERSRTADLMADILRPRAARKGGAG